MSADNKSAKMGAEGPRSDMLRPTTLLLAQVFPPKHGGSGRWLFELYRRLVHRRVRVVAGDAPGAAAFDQTSALPTARVAFDFASWGLLNATALLQHWRLWSAARHLAVERGVTSVHCAKALPEGTIALALRQTHSLPFSVFAHGEELTLAGTSRELRALTGTVLRRAERVIANSRHTHEMLTRDWRVSPDRVHVLHPGVDTTRFVPAPADAATRAALGWTGRTVVLTVGTLQRRKGQDTMLRALPAIRSACPDVLYVMAGEGPDRSMLERLAVDLQVSDAVQFRGAPDEADLVRLYQQCDLFVLASRRIGWDLEGFGIVALEAQACGRPAVVGAAGGAPETVLHGRTGRVVDCDEPTDLAAAVVDLLRDSVTRQRWGDEARRWVVENFEWDVLARHADAVFTDHARERTDVSTAEGAS